MLKLRSICLLTLLINCMVAFPNSLNATTVRFATNVGSFDVALFDEATPITVGNFLDYVDSGAYENTIIHRSPPNFVIQGGGYRADFSEIQSNDPIVNESEISNQRGTIAMARTSDPNSATNQWFINVVDNEHLDGGFAVFGEVLGDGMSVVTDINDLATRNAGGAFGLLPVLDPSLGNTPDNLVVIQNISVVPEPPAISLTLVAFIAFSAIIRRRW